MRQSRLTSLSMRRCAAGVAFVPLVASGQYADAGATMERVAPGVYAIIHADAIRDFPSGATQWPHSNVGVIVGARCVLVVDSDFLPSRAEADIRLIRQVTDKPVCYLVNTHWHGDHTHGNGVYARQFPGLQIIGTRETRDYISVNQARYPRRVIAANSASRAALAQLQALRTAGADSSGRPFTSAEKALLSQVIEEVERQLHEFATVAVAPPTRLFAGSLTLDLGGLTVRIRSRGRANSPDDITVLAEHSGVLFAGDIVVHPVPYAFGVHPTHWVRVLRDIEREKPRVLVPGHGPVMRDLTYVVKVRELFETIISRVTTLAREGRSAAEVAAEVQLDDLSASWLDPKVPNTAAYWQQSIARSLIESTYQCVIGSRC